MFRNVCWAAWQTRLKQMTGAVWPPEIVQAGPPEIDFDGVVKLNSNAILK